MSRVPIIALTGGPCGGKTTLLQRLAKLLPKNGISPLFVPEAASEIIIEAGGQLPKNREENFRFQEKIFNRSLANERAQLYEAQQLLLEGKNPVVICDRGVMDGKAYFADPSDFGHMLRFRSDVQEIACRDIQYDGVIHLRTAAYGAEEHYSCEDHETRYENSIESAQKRDDRILQAWMGTPHLSIVPNRPGQTFDGKMDRAGQEVLRILGMPVPMEHERRWLVKQPVSMNTLGFCEDVLITQRYLATSTERHVRRVRSRYPKYRTDPRYAHYYLTEKIGSSGGSCQEPEKVIFINEHEQLIKNEGVVGSPVSKIRTYFVYQDQYFELDLFQDKHEGLQILELELLSPDEPVDLPDFLGELIEITGDKSYSNYALATAA